MKRALLPLGLVASIVGCVPSGRHGAIDASHFVPKSDRQLERELGSYPTPGQSVSQVIHDTHGAVVGYPVGRLSFAEEVIEYEVGGPAPIPEGQHPKEALGPPDYVPDTHRLPRAVSLGNGGFLTLRFAEGALTDGEGPDLFVFEIGPSVEGIAVFISPDGKRWTSVGEVIGGNAAIDIGPYVSPDEVFSYVRLRDIPHQGAESDFWPGADIDAVGVLHADQKVLLPGELLFSLDSDALGPAAPEALDRIAEAIRHRPGSTAQIDGHTDDLGDDAYNQKLSERRAEAVASYLEGKGIARERLTVRGHGRSAPIAPNTSDENRQKNRRVEIVIQGR
ncbi:MAG: OmpA family protein [Byssovorax sp.]